MSKNLGLYHRRCDAGQGDVPVDTQLVDLVQFSDAMVVVHEMGIIDGNFQLIWFTQDLDLQINKQKKGIVFHNEGLLFVPVGGIQ